MRSTFETSISPDMSLGSRASQSRQSLRFSNSSDFCCSRIGWENALNSARSCSFGNERGVDFIVLPDTSGNVVPAPISAIFFISNEETVDEGGAELLLGHDRLKPLVRSHIGSRNGHVLDGAGKEGVVISVGRANDIGAVKMLVSEFIAKHLNNRLFVRNFAHAGLFKTSFASYVSTCGTVMGDPLIRGNELIISQVVAFC